MVEKHGLTLSISTMHSLTPLATTMTQANRLLQATLDIPREFWRGHEQLGQASAGLQNEAQPEGDMAQVQQAMQQEATAASQANSPHVVPIRSLSVRHRERIAQHILALSAHDRYLRFGYQASDEQVRRYVQDMDFNRDEIYGIFNRRLQLIAMAHLAFSSDPKNASCAEFGVSVSESARGKGLGTHLFARAILHARAEGVDMLFIHALSENEAMLKIARKAGAVVESYGGEVEAHVRLPAQDFGDRVEIAVKDAVEDGLGEVDYRLKLRALQFWEFLGALQEIRQGVQKGRRDSDA
jgi:RimJ/RimL family protein N-acetyltransferase